MSWTQIRQLLLISAAVIFAAVYGVFARGHGWFPAPQIVKVNELIARANAKLHNKGPKSFYYIAASNPRRVAVHNAERLSPGLTLVNELGPNDALNVRLVDEHGAVQHGWNLDWDKLWPHPTHLAADALPKGGKGVMSFGAQVSGNGDLTFNFEQLGMVQLDVCGKVNWRLPRQANHSLFTDEQGNLWTPEIVVHRTRTKELINYKLPYVEHFILEVSPQGKVLKRVSVMKLLQQNEYNGLLFMKSSNNLWSTQVSGDTLHITSVTVFPSTMKSGLFKPGDILVSLNAINTVMVFDPEAMVIKASLTGKTLRQSDADFLDGDTITIFDNHAITSDLERGSSRITEHNFRTGAERILFQGDAVHPFYSPIMGRHQHLANGNMLLTEGTKGRVLEISRQGEVLWEYFNVIGPKMLAIVEDADRVSPQTLTLSRLKQLKAACPA